MRNLHRFLRSFENVGPDVYVSPCAQICQTFGIDVAGRWRFVYAFVIGEYVERRREMWSWDRIRTHRHFFREYKRLWVTYLTSYIVSTADTLDIEVLLSRACLVTLRERTGFDGRVPNVWYYYYYYHHHY